MFDPATVPMPVRAADREAEGAQHPLLAALVNHPFLASPDDEKHLRQLRATYYGMQAEVDDQLGRLLDALDASGEADRTIVVMTSDHGEMLGDHFLLHKLGWFDSSFHVPLIVRDPRAEADAGRGEVVDAYTEHVDVLPTLLDLLGAEVPLQCDGRPLTGFLHGSRGADDEPAWREETHFEFDFRDADSDLLERAFGLDAGGVLDRGAARRPRQVRALRRPAADLLRSRHRPRADREPRRRPCVRAVGARVRAAHAVLAHAAPGTHAHRA